LGTEKKKWLEREKWHKIRNKSINITSYRRAEDPLRTAKKET